MPGGEMVVINISEKIAFEQKSFTGEEQPCRKQQSEPEAEVCLAYVRTHKAPGWPKWNKW